MSLSCPGLEKLAGRAESVPFESVDPIVNALGERVENIILERVRLGRLSRTLIRMRWDGGGDALGEREGTRRTLTKTTTRTQTPKVRA